MKSKEDINLKRKLIKIDDQRCNGCGLCIDACHEGAISLVNGKAVLMRDDYCDGLGDCLPACPINAISFEERESVAYDEVAVKENMKRKESLLYNCPGTISKSISKREKIEPVKQLSQSKNRLSQWPVQIKLVPTSALYFNGANLLIAADCSAFAYGDFHDKFIKNHITLIGCPKLDLIDYSEKLTEIIKSNNIKSIKVVRMEVPCCGGIESAVKDALKNSGKFIPWQVFTLSTDGRIIE